MESSVVLCHCITSFCLMFFSLFFFFKQKTAYEMRISDWSSDVCSSDLIVMLDELSLDDMRTAVAINGGRAKLEASGGISDETLRSVAEKIGRASCRERVCQYV